MKDGAIWVIVSLSRLLKRDAFLSRKVVWHALSENHLFHCTCLFSIAKSLSIICNTIQSVENTVTKVSLKPERSPHSYCICVPFLITFQLSPEHKINSTALLGTMWLYIAQKRLAKDSLITYIQDGLALGSNPRFRNTTSVTDLQLAWI